MKKSKKKNIEKIVAKVSKLNLPYNEHWSLINERIKQAFGDEFIFKSISVYLMDNNHA